MNAIIWFLIIIALLMLIYYILYKNTLFFWLATTHYMNALIMKYYLSLPYYNLADYFESCVKAFKNREALVFEDRKWTYEQLNREANKIAHWGLSTGLRAGDVICLYMRNRPEYFFTWLGLHKIGVGVSLINTEITGQSLSHVLNESDSKVIIVGPELLKNLSTLSDLQKWKIWVYAGENAKEEKVEKYESLDKELRNASDAPVDPKYRRPIKFKDLAFYIFTSGTTGFPKAAILSHKRAFEIWKSTHTYSGITKDDRMYVTLPLYHTSGNLIGTGVWSIGGTVVLDRKFSASRWLQQIKKYDVTCFLYIGELLRYLLSTPETPEDKNHKCVRVFGNGLRPDVWEKFTSRFGIKYVNEFYSSTEGNITIMNFDSKIGACGYVPPITFYLGPCRIIKFDVEKEEPIRNEQGFCIECDWDEVGEMIGKINNNPKAVHGQFHGYKNKDATNKKILRDVFKKGDLYFRTGDLLKFDRNGYVYFVDRIGDTFRWKGENVATSEVQSVISQFEEVEECNVYGVHVPNMDGRAGMAVIIPKNFSTFDLEKLYLHTTKNLTDYANPLFLRIQKEMTKTTTFKYKKIDLVAQGFNPNLVKEELYFRDKSKGKYIPITNELYEQICNGKVRL